MLNLNNINAGITNIGVNAVLNTSIDVSSLSNGVYFIKVGNNTKKFINE